jgi:hypothetical protein
MKDLELPADASITVQSPTEGITEAVLGNIMGWPFDTAQAIEFIRLDAHDYALIWERSGEWERLTSAGEYHDFTAILGFGADTFDVQFASKLLATTATEDIRHSANSLWPELGILYKLFGDGPIDPSRGIKNG